MLRDARARTAQPPWRAGPKPSSPRGPGRTAGTTPATSDPLDMTTERADLYVTLGVRPSATQAEISHAYRALLRRYHPDTRPDDESQNATSDAALQHVLAAYTVLHDPRQRADYDRRRRPPAPQHRRTRATPGGSTVILGTITTTRPTGLSPLEPAATPPTAITILDLLRAILDAPS